MLQNQIGLLVLHYSYFINFPSFGSWAGSLIFLIITKILMRERSIFIVLFLALIGSTSTSMESPTTLYAPLSKEIILHGRYYVEGSNVMYDWTCFKIDFCFENSKRVVWNVIDTWNIYHVVLDGNTTKVIHPKKETKITIFEANSPQSHCIEIIKITENHYGPLASHKDSAFNGIELDAGSLVRNTKRYDYKFDFLGDSVTTAFGVMSGRNPACFFKMKRIQNCRESWAVHLSKMFNADYRLEAVSGKGVVRNAFGVPGAKMPSLFSRNSDNSKENSYKIQDSYVPDVLFLFIGANDYNNIKNPSINNFVNGYTSMLQKIMKDYMIYAGQGTKIISICDIQFSKELCYNVKTAVKNFSYAYKLIYYLQIPEGTQGKKYLGCIGHPNAEGQRRLASSLYEGVKEILRK